MKLEKLSPASTIVRLYPRWPSADFDGQPLDEFVIYSPIPTTERELLKRLVENEIGSSQLPTGKTPTNPLIAQIVLKRRRLFRKNEVELLLQVEFVVDKRGALRGNDRIYR